MLQNAAAAIANCKIDNGRQPVLQCNVSSNFIQIIFPLSPSAEGLGSWRKLTSALPTCPSDLRIMLPGFSRLSRATMPQEKTVFHAPLEQHACGRAKRNLRPSQLSEVELFKRCSRLPIQAGSYSIKELCAL